jgi:hypothetical protein
VATASYEAIAAAIAGRFLAAQVTPPAGYANIRSSTANAPGAIGPTPAVVVSLDSFEFETGNSTRVGAQAFFVRFYFDQTSDLERTEPAIRKWVDVLIGQLKASVQLAGLVDRAVISAGKVGILAYGGVDYTGCELTVHTATSEGWVATA